MILDGHIHVGRWNYSHYSSLEVRVRSLNDLLESCEIEGGILMPSDQKDNEGLLKEIQKDGKKKKYWFFAWVDPKQKDIFSFLEKNVSSIRGVKIHSSLDEVQGGITHPSYKPLLEFISAYHLPILVHCGRRQDTASFSYVLEVAPQYKDVSFIMCHLGGDFEMLKLKAPLEVKQSGLKNVFFDISATREVWTIEKAVQILGAEKLLFGSDYPVMHPKVAIETIRVLNISEKEKNKIFGENLLEILGGS